MDRPEKQHPKEHSQPDKARENGNDPVGYSVHDCDVSDRCGGEMKHLTTGNRDLYAEKKGKNK
jgi:hypothetical protein